MKKQRIRIYTSHGRIDYIDISKGLKCFYSEPLSLQWAWCMSLGERLNNFDNPYIQG